MSVANVMLMLKKQREEQQNREKDRQERTKQRISDIYKQNQATTDRMREQNTAVGAQVIQDPLGGLFYGLLTGIGENLTEQQNQHRADLMAAREYVNSLNQQMRGVIQNETKQAMTNDWFEMNKEPIGKMLEQAMNMSPDQAKRAFEPFFSDLENKVGDRYKIEDFNPSNGVMTIRGADGVLKQTSLLDDYPELKQRKMYEQGMAQSGYTDQDILAQAQKEEDEKIGHQKRMEGLARERFEYEKTKEKQALEQDVFQGNKILKELYQKDMQQGIKDREDWDKQIMDSKRDIEKRKNFLQMLDRLQELKSKKSNNILLNSNNPVVGKIRDLVANGEPITEKILTTLGITNKEDIEFIQNYTQEIKNILSQFYSQYGASFAGGGNRSDRDMEMIQKNIVPLFFSPGEGLTNSLKHYRTITENEINNYVSRAKVYQDKRLNLAQQIKDPRLWYKKTGA